MLENLKKGLFKTRASLKNRLDMLFGKKEIDEEFYEELEEILLSADVGVETTLNIINSLQKRLKEEKIRDLIMAKEILKNLMVEKLRGGEQTFSFSPSDSPLVILVLGVNGVGKTTTIAKMAYHFNQQGKKVLLAAGDTFRAAAIEQLEEWTSNLPHTGLIKHQSGGDPSAVIFDAVKAAEARGIDVLICDTAGRLHTKKNLVEEMSKIYRVCGKALEGAPDEILLVLDATTGQNSIAQAKYFQEAMPVSGLVLTKLDGTARGGIIFAVKEITGIPVKLIGTGEKLEDLQPFQAEDYVEALLY